ncbi:ceramide synthase 1-like protein, partial [Sarcoptes scabiei]
ISVQITTFDLVLIATLSFGFTLARLTLTKYLLRPIIERIGIRSIEADKIPESLWKLCFYLATWIACSYYLFYQTEGIYFDHPTTVWNGKIIKSSNFFSPSKAFDLLIDHFFLDKDYSMSTKIDGFIYVIYMAELSFYIHSLYTTIRIDQRRKDTWTMMCHHLICVLLISLSYCNRSHKSGLLTLFLHDGCDVLLETTKLIRYCKIQHGHSYDWAEMMTNRLYLFPMKIIYVASVYVEQQKIPVPFITILVTMLWIILLMNFYWFTFALRLLYKIATGQIDELEDSTEFEQKSSKDIDESLRSEKREQFNQNDLNQINGIENQFNQINYDQNETRFDDETRIDSNHQIVSANFIRYRLRDRSRR